MIYLPWQPRDCDLRLCLSSGLWHQIMFVIKTMPKNNVIHVQLCPAWYCDRQSWPWLFFFVEDRICWSSILETCFIRLLYYLFIWSRASLKSLVRNLRTGLHHQFHSKVRVLNNLLKYSLYWILKAPAIWALTSIIQMKSSCVLEWHPRWIRIILSDHPRNCLFVYCAGRTERTTAGQVRWNWLRSSGRLFDPRGNRRFLHFVHSWQVSLRSAHYIFFLASVNDLLVASWYCAAIPRSVGQTRGISSQEWAHRRKDRATACTVLLV
jgi:hypothetical protein